MSQARRPPDEQESDSLAIAIKGDAGSASGRPRVIASGRGSLAEQILEIAFAHDVKVRSDADLAEILSAVEVDSEIPLAALVTVAEILSYVYRAEGLAGGAAPPADDLSGRRPPLP